MGKSKPWPFALEKMTGTRKMSVAPIKEYFKPLIDWMVNERCTKGYPIGWPGTPGTNAAKCPENGSTSRSFSWLVVLIISTISIYIH